MQKQAYMSSCIMPARSFKNNDTSRHVCLPASGEMVELLIGPAPTLLQEAFDIIDPEKILATIRA